MPKTGNLTHLFNHLERYHLSYYAESMKMWTEETQCTSSGSARDKKYVWTVERLTMGNKLCSKVNRFMLQLLLVYI